MFYQVRSSLQRVFVEINRTIDQSWLKIFGLPTLSRSMITANIILGGQYNIGRLPDLKKIGVSAIVNMRLTSVQNPELLKDFKYLHLPTPDQTPPSIEDLQKGVYFIDEVIKNNQKVYIHCRFGEGRGPSMVIAYLIFSGMTYDDAFATVKKVRTFVRPTPSQIEQLKHFEKINQKKP